MGVYGGQNRVSRRSRQGVYDGQGWAVEVRTWCLLRSGRGAYEGQNFIDGGRGVYDFGSPNCSRN